MRKAIQTPVDLHHDLNFGEAREREKPFKLNRNIFSGSEIFTRMIKAGKCGYRSSQSA